MLSSYCKRLPHYFARIFYIQLVLSIYSLLILLFWGLPFCPLSFLGNMIFNPVLVVFLGLCTLLFFTELLFIPNGYLIWVIELVTSSWMFMLRAGSTNAFNLSFKTPSYALIAAMACATFLIVVSKNSYLHKNGYLLVVLIGSFWLMSQTAKPIGLQEIPCTQGQIHLISTEKEIVIIDPGYLGRYISAPDIVEYKLMPLLTSSYGTRTIDHFVVLQPSQNLFQALSKLLEIATIKHLYIPYWRSAPDSKKVVRSFMKMKELATQKGCIITRISGEQYNLGISDRSQIEIQDMHQIIDGSSVSYKAYMVLGRIDNQPFTFYPAKCSQQVSTIG